MARRILEENREKFEAMTAALLEWETIDADQIEDIACGRPPRPPKERSGGTGGTGGTPSAPAAVTASAPAAPAAQ